MRPIPRVRKAQDHYVIEAMVGGMVVTRDPVILTRAQLKNLIGDAVKLLAEKE